MGVDAYLSWLGGGGGEGGVGVGVERLSTFSAFRMGANSR